MNEASVNFRAQIPLSGIDFISFVNIYKSKYQLFFLSNLLFFLWPLQYFITPPTAYKGPSQALLTSYLFNQASLTGTTWYPKEILTCISLVVSAVGWALFHINDVLLQTAQEQIDQRSATDIHVPNVSRNTPSVAVSYLDSKTLSVRLSSQSQVCSFVLGKADHGKKAVIWVRETENGRRKCPSRSAQTILCE